MNDNKLDIEKLRAAAKRWEERNKDMPGQRARRFEKKMHEAERDNLNRKLSKFAGRKNQKSAKTQARYEFIREMMAELQSKKPAAVASHVTAEHPERARELWGSEGLLEVKILNFVNNHRKKFDSYR